MATNSGPRLLADAHLEGCVIISIMHEMLHPSRQVAQALAEGGPVVALESTVITHGLPYPQNVNTALAMEAAVREGGAEPATVAVARRGGLEKSTPQPVRATTAASQTRRPSSRRGRDRARGKG